MVSTIPPKPSKIPHTNVMPAAAMFTDEPDSMKNDSPTSPVTSASLPKPRLLSTEGHTRNHHRSHTGSALDGQQHAEDAKKLNRVLIVLMRRLNSSKTFGENVIFMLNRAGE